MLLVKNIGAALKGGVYLPQRGRYWQGVNLITGGDYAKTYELFNEIPFVQAFYSGGLAVTTEEAWAHRQRGEKHHEYKTRIPLFKDGFNQVNKVHVRNVSKGYEHLVDIRKENGAVCSKVVEANLLMLSKFASMVPDEFTTQIDTPFSNEWFIELMNYIPDGESKDELQDMLLYCGLDKEGNSVEGTGWHSLSIDLKGLYECFIHTSMEPIEIKDRAVRGATLLTMPTSDNAYIQAVISVTLCETMTLIQLSLRERECSRSTFAVTENYPVVLDLKHYSNLACLRYIMHTSRASHMAIFMTVNDMDALEKREGFSAIIGCGFKLFDTSFSKGKGAYGFTEQGKDKSTLKKVFLN